MESKHARRYLSPLEVRSILGIGRNATYDLFNANGFPGIRLGKRRLVRADLLDEWLLKNYATTEAENRREAE